MPGVDKECEGEGATHHHACKCREAHFAQIEGKLEMAKEALQYYAAAGTHDSHLNRPDHVAWDKGQIALDALKEIA